MFARRQKRMEQFVIGNNPEEQEEGTNHKSILSSEEVSHQENADEVPQSQMNPIVEKESNMIHSEEEVLRQRPMNDEKLSTEKTNLKTSTSTEGQPMHKERMSWSSSSCTGASNCDDSFFDDKPDSINHLHEEEEDYSSLGCTKLGFRTVKPPCPRNISLPSPDINQIQEFNWHREEFSLPQFTTKTNKSSKTWSSVKFQPKAKESLKPSGEMKQFVNFEMYK